MFARDALYVPKVDVLEGALRRELDNFCFSESLLNRIIYDCVEESNYTKEINPLQYDMLQLPYYLPTSEEDTTLVFESRFESGNLRRAIQIREFEYNLICKPDYYT